LTPRLSDPRNFASFIMARVFGYMELGSHKKIVEILAATMTYLCVVRLWWRTTVCATSKMGMNDHTRIHGYGDTCIILL
jgi:hypothetical protein